MKQFILALCLVLISTNLFSQDLTDENEEGKITPADSVDPLESFWQTDETVNVGDQVAEMDIRKEYIFCDGEKANMLMELWGNSTSDETVGLLSPNDLDETDTVAAEKGWVLLFEYSPVGYVSDEDQDDIDPDELLESITEGTEDYNEYRMEKGYPPLQVLGWKREPYYDPQTNNLSWSILGASEGEQFVNHNINLLGRRGFMSVTILCDVDKLDAAIDEVNDILENDFRYLEGERYHEFVEGDKIAEYGLAGLVLAGAGAGAVKLGLFAQLGKFLAKIWKFLLIGLVAIWAAIKKLFKKTVKNEETVEMPSETTTENLNELSSDIDSENTTDMKKESDEEK
jgi:uncharacterized membrane-anchored protein